MIIEKPAKAGSLESSDILIMVHPDEDLKIELNSKIKEQFGEQIVAQIVSVLDQHDIQSGRIVANDNGALDFTIRARVKSALMRSKAGEDHV